MLEVHGCQVSRKVAVEAVLPQYRVYLRDQLVDLIVHIAFGLTVRRLFPFLRQDLEGTEMRCYDVEFPLLDYLLRSLISFLLLDISMDMLCPSHRYG